MISDLVKSDDLIIKCTQNDSLQYIFSVFDRISMARIGNFSLSLSLSHVLIDTNSTHIGSKSVSHRKMHKG